MNNIRLNLNFPKLNLSKINLSKIDFSKINLSKINFSKINISKLNLSRQIICAVAILNCAYTVFAESEEDFKKRVLANANLADQSATELMAEDNENDDALTQENQKRLPTTFQREVPYTDAQLDFINAYYDHKILSDEMLEKLYDDAILSAYQLPEEYDKLVSLSRAEYFRGITIFETWDPTSLNSIDLTDNVTTETINDKAGDAFDRAINFAERALHIKSGSDAYTILAHSISANCTAKNSSYILANGLKVRSYAKKAVKLDYSNGTAHFLSLAQDIYAPQPFAKLRSGRKKMIAVLNDKYIRLDDQDRLLICTAVGYSFYQQKKWRQAAEWYNKALEIYPDNYSSHQMLEKIQNRKK